MVHVLMMQSNLTLTMKPCDYAVAPVARILEFYMGILHERYK